jgi:choline kinase
MKAIIVAAGPSTRLRPLTNEKPKCLLEIGGKTILQRALDALRANGINRIAVVRGYHSNLINYPDITYYENPNYAKTNILRSLFCAQSEMNDDLIISYSDIIYSSDTVAKLLDGGNADSVLTVDIDWSKRYRGRDKHPVSEAELVNVDNGRVTAIGKGVVKPDNAYGEFIGLAKFSRVGSQEMRDAYHRVAKERPAAPFHRSLSLDGAYLSDMLQELMDTGRRITTVDIKGGWIEIDTPQDLEEARRKFADSS